MLPGCGPDAGSATLLPQPRRSKAMTRYPARPKSAICGCQISLVPVLECKSTMGVPAPPVSVNQSLPPGRSTCAPRTCSAAAAADPAPNAATTNTAPSTTLGSTLGYCRRLLRMPASLKKPEQNDLCKQ